MQPTGSGWILGLPQTPGLSFEYQSCEPRSYPTFMAFRLTDRRDLAGLGDAQLRALKPDWSLTVLPFRRPSRGSSSAIAYTDGGNCDLSIRSGIKL